MDSPDYQRLLEVVRLTGGSWRNRFKEMLPLRDLAGVKAFLASVNRGDRTPSLYRYLAALLGDSGDAPVGILHEGLTEHPTDFWLLYDIAACHLQRRQSPLAYTALRSARALRPDVPRLIASLGLVLLDMGNLAAAERHLNESLDLEPSAPTYNDLGNLKVSQKDYQAAIVAYGKAIEVDANYAKAHNGLGMTHQKLIVMSKDLMRLDDALRSFRTAIECDPNYITPRINLALLLLTGKDDPAGAVAALQSLMDRKPKLNPPERMRVYVTLGMALSKLDRLDEALAALREAESADRTSQLVQGELKGVLARIAERERNAPKREPAPPPRPAGAR